MLGIHRNPNLAHQLCVVSPGDWAEFLDSHLPANFKSAGKSQNGPHTKIPTEALGFERQQVTVYGKWLNDTPQAARKKAS